MRLRVLEDFILTRRLLVSSFDFTSLLILDN